MVPYVIRRLPTVMIWSSSSSRQLLLIYTSMLTPKTSDLIVLAQISMRLLFLEHRHEAEVHHRSNPVTQSEYKGGAGKKGYTPGLQINWLPWRYALSVLCLDSWPLAIVHRNCLIMGPSTANQIAMGRGLRVVLLWLTHCSHWNNQIALVMGSVSNLWLSRCSVQNRKWTCLHPPPPHPHPHTHTHTIKVHSLFHSI